MKRVLLVALVILLVGVLIFSACQAQPAPSPSPAPKPAPAAPTSPPAPAPAPKPTVAPPSGAPKPDISNFIMTALPSGSLGYTMMVGVGEAIKKTTGIPLRIIPGGTDVARVMPVARGDAHLALLVAPSTFHITHGLGSTYSMEEWGPQALRIVWEGTTGGTGWPVRGNAGIKTGADLKGKRIGIVAGHPMFEATQWSSQAAALAFFDLTWKDVTPVPVASSAVGYKAIIEGSIDTMFLDIAAAGARELEASQYGIYHVTFPHANVEAWKKLTKIAPYIYPRKFEKGTGPQFKEGKPVEVSSFGYSIVSYPQLSNDIAYAFTKGMWDGYDQYKAAHPNLVDWNRERMLAYKTLFHPYHDGTVKFLRDIGVWTPAMEEWQKKQVKLEKDRQDAWWKALETAGKQKIKLSTPEFADFWRKTLMDNNLISYPEL